MDVREKLVELLQDGDNPVWGWFPNNATMIQLADYLIAHGVTVQEWISVDPCSCCGYGGKHLDAPPCTTCPAHPKEHQPNAR